MKYEVSVVKKIALLLMTMALAVAMVACEAATGAQGEPGETGAPGQQGPPGEPGTTDNEPPMVTKALEMAYLALAGSGKMDMKTIDLSEHFMDKENAALVYKAATSDKAVATYKIDGAKLTVTGKGAGTATITVNAYDGVNVDPTTSSFDVMVVASNARPIVDLATSFATPPADGSSSRQVLRGKLYITNPRGKTTIAATIHAGDDPFADEVSFSYDMGAAGKDDDVVDVEITPKAGAANMWEIKLMPLSPGIQNVYVTVKDKFGATAETPKNVDADKDGIPGGVFDSDEDAGSSDVAQEFQFVAFVNAVPEMDKALPDKTILLNDAETVTIDAADRYIKISEHFNTAERAASKGPKIPDMAVLAVAPTHEDAGGTALTEADGGFIPEVPNDTECTVSTSAKDVVVVAIAAGTGATAFGTGNDNPVDSVTIAATSDDVFIQGRKAGTAIITVTCRDNEDSASTAATITVRAPRG